MQQWTVVWAGLAILAVVAAPMVRRWPHRVVVLLPLLSWVGWSLQGTLWPVALALYGAPTVLAWCGALQASDAIRRR